MAPRITAALEASTAAPSRLAFTYEETAQAAGISKRMVRKLVRNGDLAAVHIGRSVRIPRHALLHLCGATHEQEA